MIQYAGPEDALTLFPAVLFWSRLANRPHADYAAVHFTNLWSPAWGVRNGPRQLSAVYGWWTRERENERKAKERKNRKRQRKRVREVEGGVGDTEGKIREGNGVRYENIRWDVKTVNSGAFVLSPRPLPLLRTRKSTGLMVSFIISYTLVVLPVRVRPKSQPLSTLSPCFFSFQSFRRCFSLSLFHPLSEVNQPKKCALRLICRSIFCVPRCVHIFLFRTINHKLMCVRPRRVYGCLRGSFEEIKIELLAKD